jgi:hypothetical protein
MEHYITEHGSNIYFNLMKYTFTNQIYNIIFIILENMPLLFAIDNLYNSDILTQVFSPFYFFSPHLYLDMINEQMDNECAYKILNFTSNRNNTIDNNPYGDITQGNDNSTFYYSNKINFFNTTLHEFDLSFCLYNTAFIYIAIAFILLTLGILFAFSLIRITKVRGCLKNLFLYFSANALMLFLRPFAIWVFQIFFNRPLIILYQSAMISNSYSSIELVITIVSVLLSIVFLVMVLLHNKYLNNPFYFERYPFDYYSVTDTNLLLILKILVAFKINFLKIQIDQQANFVDFLAAIFVFIRFLRAIANRNRIVNNLYVKLLNNIFSTFYFVQIILKFINYNFIAGGDYILTLIIEILIFLVFECFLIFYFLKLDENFTFSAHDRFIDESFRFLYHINTAYKEQVLTTTTARIELLIDNIVIGHKMKCKLYECKLCLEDIYNPNMHTFMQILYQQLLNFETDIKEENEIFFILKILFLKFLDDDKLHRIALIVLKNKHASPNIMLRTNYVYRIMLDEINTDLKNLMTLKYGEIYDNLAKVIKYFEDVFGHIKSRTEKVEIVISKTNEIGSMYNKLINDLFFLKKNKRIYFDRLNMLQIICIIRLLFEKNIDDELLENVDFNFGDFLANIDDNFERDLSFIVNYDFDSLTFRIRKVPKVFTDITKYEIHHLIDQSLEKIFPQFIARHTVKNLNELLSGSILDQGIIFKTYVIDVNRNIRSIKFIINLIPNLEKSYVLHLECHFQRRQLMIIDDKGNFVNCSEDLYKKIGITSDLVHASKGKINIYNVFNIEKHSKLEELKIIYISKENLIDITKKIFLLETDNPDNPDKEVVPNYLNDFINNERRAYREKIFVNMHEQFTLNDIRYLIYTIKIHEEDKKDNTNKEDITVSDPTIAIKSMNRINESSSTLNTAERKVTRYKYNKKSTEIEGINGNDNYKNYMDYYNYFYDTHRSASMTMDYQPQNFGSKRSLENSENSDMFNFLYIKTNLKIQTRSNNFRKFLRSIYIFNLILVFISLFSVFYFTAISNSTSSIVNGYSKYNKLRTRICSTTINMMAYLTYDKTTTNSYSNYIASKYNSNFDFDSYIKNSLSYHSTVIFNEMTDYKLSANYLFKNEGDFFLPTEYAYFQTIENFYVKKDENFEDILDYISISANAIVNKYFGIYFDIRLIDFDPNTNKLKGINPVDITLSEHDYFQGILFLYQFIYNYFDNYYDNLNNRNNFYIDKSSQNINSLQNQAQIMLVILVILHIIFIFCSLFSVIIYKRILKQEFTTLYSINEEKIGKIKQKYILVKELIKSEKHPSKIYEELRKIREIDFASVNKRNPNNAKGRGSISSPEKKLVRQNTTGTTGTNVTNKTNNTEMTVNSNSLNAIYKTNYLKYAGSSRAFNRSNTEDINRKMDDLKKEQEEKQISLAFLNRLKFDFEFIRNYIYFIIFMSLFYLVLGSLVLYFLNVKYYYVSLNLQFENLLVLRKTELYNYLIGVKFSVILNKDNPFSFTPDPEKLNNIIDKYYTTLIEYNGLETSNSNFDIFKQSDIDTYGDAICQSLYANNIDFINSSSNSTNIINDLQNLCENIPILKSNTNSIFSDLIMTARGIYNDFRSNNTLASRIDILQNKFKSIDIVLLTFADPFFAHQYYELNLNNTARAVSDYLNLLIVILFINIIIDFFMLIFIWIKIYKQVMNYVNNVQLVTDSLCVI